MFKASSIALPAALLVALTGCEAGSGGSGGALETDAEKASYAVGLNVGPQLSAADGILDMDAFARGVQDAMSGSEPAVPQEELQAALEWLQGEVEAVATEQAASNQAEGEAFLAENAERDEVTVTESGLQYEVLREGEGDPPGREDRARLHYRGTLVDGTEFDSSYDGEPATFGVGQVIPGFTEALMLMAPGSHYRVYIPSHLGYGPQGSQGAIGPNAALIFEIEMIEVIGDSTSGEGQP